jgi:lipoprotein-anchoring transpeptidase ErfK/SrfK
VTAAMMLETACALAQHVHSAPAAGIAPETPTEPVRRLVVSVPNRKLALIEDGRVVKIYRIAVGAKDSPSPSGSFTIAHRIPQPTYYAPGIVTPPGPENPLGTRWIGLNVKSLGIHGTNQPGSIGRRASHGCVRMRNQDVEDLFERVRSGDSVELIAERTEEVARIFGGSATPPRVLTAHAVTPQAAATDATTAE